MDQVLTHAPFILLLVALVVAGLGVPLPEDIVLLTAGALAHGRALPLPLVVVLCGAGVLAGDVLLFTTARRLGAAAYERGWMARLLPKHRRERLEGLFARHGAAVVFVARHVAGLRAPTFAMAGINAMPYRTFVFWDSLGICISVPVMVLLGHGFADHLDRVRAGIAHVEHWVLALASVALAIYAAVSGIRRLARQGADPKGGS
jgi:membrane protein DedA with SNARE-associated domain